MKKKSNVAKGNYYKAKTKKLFIDRGYQCEYLEQIKWIFTPTGRFPMKKDLFASDGLAMNGKELIFWNSKLGCDSLNSEMKKYDEYLFPPFVTLAIVAWKPRCKKPRIMYRKDGIISEE